MATNKPEYKFILCETPSPADLVANPAAPLVKIGDLGNAKNRAFQLVRNRAGTASFSLRTNDDLVPEILDGLKTSGDIRGTVRKCIRVRRNDNDLWSGPIWGVQGGLAQGLITFNCVGWLETVQKIILWNNETNLDYSNDGLGTESDTIAFGLINTCNSDDPLHPLLIRPGSVIGSMPIRIRYYPWKTTNLGPALQELSDIEAGFDYEVDPVTREVNLFSWDSYSDRKDIKLGLNFGPRNLKDVQWQEDASRTCNFMGIQSLGAPVFVNDPVSLDTYGRFDEYNQLQEAQQGILQAYGVAELVIRSRPFVTYTILPNARMNTFGPTLFDDFQIGDKVYWSATKDGFKIKNQAIRVFGASVTVDDNGNENVTALQTSPEGA